MEIIRIIFLLFIFINSGLALFTVFRERERDIAAIWAWLLVITMLPGFGFIIYLFLGRKISKENIFDIRSQKRIGMNQLVEAQKQLIETENLDLPETKHLDTTLELVSLFLESNESILTKGNQVDIIIDGKEKFDRLIKDIQKAKHHIHVTYYIFKADGIGTRLLKALEERAAKGVEVKVLYDPIGARVVGAHFFDHLKSLGGQAEPFLGAKQHILNFRLNYRNHRKIVVIDGKIGYTGGFNVGDDYLGLYEKMGYWRDTHLRIKGNGVLPLQTRFLMDWNASVKNQIVRYKESYFPVSSFVGTTDLQIVSSGPDNEVHAIKKGLLKMISMAKHSVYIQTPYFIPDEAVMETLKIASLSGIDVKLMIPNKPDHPFIYRATLSYVEEMVNNGVEVYIYDAGFLHAKTIVIDGEILSVGTANFDIRSFKLNFEVNTFMYDRILAKQQVEIFKKDIEVSYQLTEDIIKNYSKWELFKQQFSRLFSPIL
ncbi:cardiolipin synthase [Marinilactibacillus psychrotolerans]|uniref:Cardiolipin synthase n=1 Tax=Marinilactibacillus psychrotolerans TaxID=191770 RepID=A0AAV3WS05_9LACT|nr:cardiolipin synthase [Marinilactibacillus psychrotolerans]GEL66173.1 cardiolipin synthase [Marinilactibacillus psychrotolerans]GEQ32953.1 cardiolipin synthase [Marinilactibacillus psychrotolerans]GEQ34682.1 cardiolipin synthase [Marinilactibacillus psychrotolerans]SDB95691.1 cardiolipin synthase [Marinilactibacillus psychrotolerans]